MQGPSPAVELRRLSRIAKGLTTRYSELALARIAKGGGLSDFRVLEATGIGTRAARARSTRTLLICPSARG
ncbi:hypothetical protein DXU07_16265 [Bradyrhizobium elkanii]|nr:hypothetical protein [Bradyrhizobium elkanii]